ncbi:hypothetical protein F442_15505 [Phytophthora nicotianae P10297]|uniref:Uncharacterized protein n=1 Tax=Phytophthora nicotianae P10297 TaxID=1317064 RepID=W2YPT3_PHYNI|nr:hypothetical protein F442_15505 [Phytophthora nicotianae P10297]
MELPEDAYEDELIDAFDAPESEAPTPTKPPATSPPFNSVNIGQPIRPKVQESLYPTFNDTLKESEAPIVQPSKANSVGIKEIQQHSVPPPLVQVYREEELMSEEELQRKQQQIERDMRVYQKRFDHVAKALAGETAHQIQERKKREVERLERQEKRHEAMETRLQHQIERLEEREERRARIQARHHRTSRSPSPSSDHEDKDVLAEDNGHGKQE